MRILVIGLVTVAMMGVIVLAGQAYSDRQDVQAQGIEDIVENADVSLSYCHDGEWLPYPADEDGDYQVLPYYHYIPSIPWDRYRTFIV